MDKKKVTLSLDKDILEKIKIQAVIEERTLSGLFNMIAKEYLISKGVVFSK